MSEEPICKYCTPRRRLALTLTELMVVLAILGALVTGVVPSVQLLLRKAQADDVEARLNESWNLALAYAQSQQQPVIWTINADERNTRVAILDAKRQQLWGIRLSVQNLRVQATVGSDAVSSGQLIVFPHGLSQPLRVVWLTTTGEQTMVLPSNLPLNSSSSTTNSEE